MAHSSEHLRNVNTYLPDFTVSFQRTIMLIARNYLQVVCTNLWLKTAKYICLRTKLSVYDDERDVIPDIGVLTLCLLHLSDIRLCYNVLM
jgi:hypothetical protein